ncbi:hypothetical protein PUN28_008687 [Cardiocondyla obscurior]|uniref:Uncharacterized protein n=1 Tax=Cardiocondyla obscurior TaxID=286306 RepID=A0AAW2FYW6_9HYME
MYINAYQSEDSKLRRGTRRGKLRNSACFTRYFVYRIPLASDSDVREQLRSEIMRGDKRWIISEGNSREFAARFGARRVNAATTGGRDSSLAYLLLQRRPAVVVKSAARTENNLL